MKKILVLIGLMTGTAYGFGGGSTDVVQPVLVVNCPTGASTNYSGIAQPVTMSNVCPTQSTNTINASGNPAITGPATLAAGTNISLSQSGSTITVTGTASAGFAASTSNPVAYAYDAHTNSVQAQDMSYAAGLPVAALQASSQPYQLVGTNGGGNTFGPLANMSSIREYQACTPVDTRGLACCGGGDGAGNYTNTCDLIHDGITTPLGNMGYSKDALLLAQLPDGRLVQAFGGGTSSTWDSGSQVLATTGTPSAWTPWYSIGNINTTREQFAYSVLKTGFPMASGGEDDLANTLNTTEVLSSTFGWVYGPTMTTPRFNHMQITLDDGRVMMCGGHTDVLTATNSCEFCDTVANTCVAGPSMITAREYFGYCKLKNGDIYVAGGYNNNPTVIALAEVFQVRNNKWVAAPSMAAARQSGINFCARDPNGNVLCGGGRADNGSFLGSFDLFNPYTWTDTATASYPFIISNHNITSMPNGQIIVTGGQNSNVANSSVTWYSALAMENKTFVGGTGILVSNATGTVTAALSQLVAQNETFTSSITAVSPIGETDGGNTFSTYISSGYILNASTSVAVAVLTNVPGFGFALVAPATYYFDCNLNVTPAASGAEYGINGPAGAVVNASIFCPLGSATAFTSGEITALNTASVACHTTAGAVWAQIKGTMTTASTSGSWELERLAVAGGTANPMLPGSACTIRRIQ